MSIEGMIAAIEKHGVLDALVSDDMLLQHQANAQVVDLSSRQLKRQAVKALLDPDTRDWYVSGTLSVGPQGGLRRLPRASRAARIDVHVETTPTGSPLVVRLTQQSPFAGETEVGVVRISPGESYGESVISEGDASAGAWLGIDIVQSGGAAGLSVTATVEAG